jgi:hypothetical protein
MIEKQEEIKKKIEEKEQMKIEKQIEITNNIALQALKKEINIEELIKHEEAEREAREEKEMLITIENEKRKKECLIKAIKEREIENQYNLKTKEATEQMENIKKETNQQIAIRRTQLKQQLENARKTAERKKNKLKQQLTTVRYEMASEMSKIYKKGDKSKCIEAANSTEKRNIYCSAAFTDDYSSLLECNEGTEFCTTCCDFEFGEFYQSDRQDCYKAVCKAEQTSISETPDVRGKWVWHEAINPK